MTALALLGAVLLHVLAQVSVTVSAPADVAARDPVLVQVDVTAPAGSRVELSPPSFAPFRVVTSSVVGGPDASAASTAGPHSDWQTTEHRFVLAAPPGASGRYAFAPFEARAVGPGGRDGVGRSAPWGVSVRPVPRSAAGVPEIVDRARIDPRSGINFHALATPDTVFVGQQATYQVGVFLDETVRGRLRRNPEFLPPELRGMLAYELPAGRASLRDRDIAGKRWDIHVFQRAVFPLAAGRTDVPRAQLTYSLPLSLGFFSREESYTARSEPVSIVAIAPPVDGRPNDWGGAVGVLRVSTRLDTLGARVGDPIVLTVRVEGTGNVKLLPRPQLSLGWAVALPGEERVQVDSASLLVSGAKEFDWIVTPRDSGDRVVPSLRYPYFDPYRRRYEVASGLPMAVRVAPGTLVAADAGDRRAAPALQIRPVDGGPLSAPLHSRAGFWLVALVAPLPAAVLMARRRPRRARRDRSPMRVLRDMQRRAPPDVRSVRRAFSAALAERVALRASDAPIINARRGVLARRLRRGGVTGETAAAAESFVHALDAATYAAIESVPPLAPANDLQRLAADAASIYESIDREARPRSALAAAAGRRRLGRGARLAIVGALGLVAGEQGLSALVTDPRAQAFEEGVRAYGSGRYGDAARVFGEVATREVRSPDAWANAGTASWAAGDTVSAAVAWQRALRLEPRADDVRVRLELMPAPQDGWISGVPPVPADWVALTGLGLWLGACAAAVLRLSGRVRGGPLTPFGIAAVVGASGSAFVAAQLARVADGSALAVVRTSGPLRAEPSLGTEARGLVERTDVARIVSRRHVWARVALDGDRAGWIEMDRLAPLAVSR